MVTTSFSRRASQTPALPRFTHVTRNNGQSIPVGKASREELISGLEQYSRRHGEYPDNYPGGPQDLSDSEGEDPDGKDPEGEDPEGEGLDGELDQNLRTPAHTRKRPSIYTPPEIPDSQPKRRRHNSQ